MGIVKTDTSNPNYYHKVVDCQWACPAHTNVPEYIRLIEQGKYTESYLLNRKSNVFPGILGRVCDRPCEPACRRGRVDEEPVAICRLKRVAADYKAEVEGLLPKIPQNTNGHKIALIGSGPASLTVANDLAPLGYEIHLFEKESKLGGAMRFSVPGFRLPENVLTEEIDYIVARGGVQVHLNHEIKSLKEFLDDPSWDAVFIGTGAPKGRDLELPGRKNANKNIHIGLDWLSNVAFGHVLRIGETVIVIGGGNTAMDCCRTALRLGAKKVSVIAPEKYEEMLASPWEKHDAESEGVEIINALLPDEFVVDGSESKLQGVRFKKVVNLFDQDRKWNPIFDQNAGTQLIYADDVILAVGQNNAYPFIAENDGVKFGNSGKPIVDPTTYASSHPKVFFGGDAAFGPKNIIWAVAQAHEAAISIHLSISGKNLLNDRPAPGLNLVSQKMGLHEWSYGQSYDELKRQSVPHLDVKERFSNLKAEVELGFDLNTAQSESKRCLNCDVQTVFAEKLCIECDACVDICPLQCLSMVEPTETEKELRAKLTVPASNLNQDLMISDPLVQTNRLMVKDEDLCIHCGLCAERCPTGAWDMQKSIIKLPSLAG